MKISSPRHPVAFLPSITRTISNRQKATLSSQDTQLAPSKDSYFSNDQRPIILYDGVCNLCNGGVNFMLEWDTQAKFRLAALQSNAGQALLQRCGRAPHDISSIVVVEPDTHYIQSRAILRIAQGLNAPLPAVAAALYAFPKPFADSVYDSIANNRYTVFGRTNQCRMCDGQYADRFIDS